MTLPETTCPAVSPSFRPQAACPRWWRQSYTWLLAALVVANIGFDALELKCFQGSSRFEPEFLLSGTWAGQLFLLGLWLAYGGLHFAARFAVVTLVVIAGAIPVMLMLGGSALDDNLILAGAGLMIAWGTHAALLPLRTLLGWRIDFDPIYHPRSNERRLQLRLVHWLVFMTACALPFIVPQFLPEDDRFMSTVITVVVGTIAVLTGAPVAYLSVVSRASRRVWTIALGIFGATLLVGHVAFGPWLGPQSSGWLIANAAIAAIVFANLIVLRLFGGLRLFSVLPGTAWSPAAADQSALTEQESAIPPTPKHLNRGQGQRSESDFRLPISEFDLRECATRARSGAQRHNT